MYITALLWFVSDLPTNGHVNIVGSWTICKLWAIWGRAALVYVSSCCILMRAYALDLVFNRKRPYRGWAVLMPIVIIAVVVLSYCISGQVISDHLTVQFLPSLQICYYSNAFRYASLAIVWMVWLVIFYYTVRIRRINSSFNEFRNYLAQCIIALLLIAETTVLHIAFPRYPLNKYVRVVNTAFDIFICNACVWIVLAYPAFQCMFNREAYLQRWLKKLREDGLQKAYGVAFSESYIVGQTHYASTAQLHSDYKRQLI
ncbi:hypothetical protein FBU59_001305 [Linderina macrospora]|uniref:Uncharacterized protein n=1 Tax=Linderina macrospora TaxID=4868 RepID=A0ACC1JE68_9FUNG|nr:hypothetical protein FBU59_001305 [Linderina macrospora]